MSIEGFLLGGSLIAALLALEALSVIASRTQQPAYKPVRVPATRRLHNTATASRSDHILK
jgi:hypothetical protein